MLDYSILLKAWHDELIHESINFHIHEFNESEGKQQSWDHNSKTKEEKGYVKWFLDWVSYTFWFG